MAKTYRSIQQWDNWLTQSKGRLLLDAEWRYLSQLLIDYYGKHVLLIGAPNQCSLINLNTIPQQIILSPLINKNKAIEYIEGEFRELPIASASVDLVLLPHTLEYVDNPHQLLIEACRIVKPEGFIIIFGFNLMSLWGLKKRFATHKNVVPWSSNSIPAGTLKKWLSLADFELVKQSTFLFQSSFAYYDKQHKKVNFIEWLASKLFSSFGGVYVLMAKAKVIPLTPIRIHWKQQLSGARVSIPGPSVRNW